MPFVKLFASITDSTIWCEDDQTRIVWITLLAMSDRKGFVAGSIPGLANRARVPIEATRKAISKFLAPDPDSSSPEHEGRRIEAVKGGWRLLNYERYREMRGEDDRRDYMRDYMRKRREHEESVNSPVNSVSNVNSGKLPLAYAEAEADVEAKKVKSFVRPSLEEVQRYCKERGNQVDAQRWLDYYTANGWRVGRNSMKDWKATVRTWEGNGFTNGGSRDGHKTTTRQRNEDNRERIARIFGEDATSDDLPATLREGPRRQ